MSAVMKDQELVSGATMRLPKGQSCRAPLTTPNETDAAIPPMPKGHDHDAAVSPSSGAARKAMPKGQKRHAAPDPHSTEAIHFLPQGHSRCAPVEPHSESAKCRPPQGHYVHADSEPNDDPAIPILPAKATVAVLDHPQTESEAARITVPKGQTASSAHSRTIDTLCELHRKRQDFHRAEKSLTLQIKAVCRRLCAGDKDEGGKLYLAAMAGSSDVQAMIVQDWMAPFVQARSILEGNRKGVEKQMEKLAKSLPIYAWVDSIKGFGAGSLAAVIGEAGDLSNYPTHSHLWKRLGLAVIDGGRQRMVSGADALKHGYCPSRRSIIWNIGGCVLKLQSQRIDKETGEVKTEAGEYRKLYDARKELELTRVETKAHAHNRSTRYVEKKLMRELWKQWRACM